VHAGAQVHEALRPLDERRQDVEGQDVDGEDVRQAVLRLDSRLLIADRGIVNDRVEAAEAIDLIGQASRLRDAGEIADHDGFRGREAAPRIVGSRGVPGVEHDPVPRLEQQPAGHEAQSVGRASDEDARHRISVESTAEEFRWGT
jgi:hypothetical protein